MRCSCGLPMRRVDVGNYYVCPRCDETGALIPEGDEALIDAESLAVPVGVS